MNDYLSQYRESAPGFLEGDALLWYYSYLDQFAEMAVEDATALGPNEFLQSKAVEPTVPGEDLRGLVWFSGGTG